MGVGEDEALEGAISITVIATGFNAEQQNEIVNTEVKKIIHTLEDEQRAEQVLSTVTYRSAYRYSNHGIERGGRNHHSPYPVRRR